MNAGDVDDVLASIDGAVDDYVEWAGSDDAASWSADGSHEYDTDGEYYMPAPGSAAALVAHLRRRRRPVDRWSMQVAPAGTSPTAEGWSDLQGAVVSWSPTSPGDAQAEFRRLVEDLLGAGTELTDWQLATLQAMVHTHDALVISTPRRTNRRMQMAMIDAALQQQVDQALAAGDMRGASLVDLPLLDEAYLEWAASAVDEGADGVIVVDEAALWAAANPPMPSRAARRSRRPVEGLEAQRSPYGPPRAGRRSTPP